MRHLPKINNACKICKSMFYYFLVILLFASFAKGKESDAIETYKLTHPISVSMGLEYVGFSAGNTHIGGLISSINLRNTNIIAKYYNLEFWFKIGAGSQKVSGNYFIGSSNSLSNLTSFRGVASMLEEIGGKFGYNITRNVEKPLFLSLGYEYSSYTHSATYNPYSTSVSYNNFLLSLDSAMRLGSSRWSIDYALFASYTPTIIYFSGVDIVSSTSNFLVKNIKQKSIFAHGFGIKGSVGVSYAISKNVYFFTKIIAKYQHTLPSNSTTITTSATPSTNEVLPQASTQVAYPQASAIYAGLQFGIGF